MSETPSTAIEARLRETVGGRAPSFIELEAAAEIASLRAQLDEARRKAIEECMAVVIEMREGFLSPEYATGQPLSSMNERIACSMILNNLTALLSEIKT